MREDLCSTNYIVLMLESFFCSPQRFPLQVTGWPLELMAYAYLVVSPPSMEQYYEEVCFLWLPGTFDECGIDA